MRIKGKWVKQNTKGMSEKSINKWIKTHPKMFKKKKGKLKDLGL